uniref:RSRC2 n=1 Tax=Heterorhabditis bacteriophora TaxID=37862 RepID=A0A1I7XMU8_HETBA
MSPMEKRSSERGRRRHDSTSRERRRRSSHYKSRDRRSDSPKMWPNKKIKEEVNSDAESPVHLNQSPVERDSRRSDRGRSPTSNRRYHSRRANSRDKERYVNHINSLIYFNLFCII